MNYVALAGVLEIDNVFMSTQSRFLVDVIERIENPSAYMYLQLYKDKKHHDRYNEAKWGIKFINNFMRLFYKVIYFYVYPILLIPLCPLLYWQSQTHTGVEYDAHPIDPSAIWAQTFDFSGAEPYIYFYAMIVLSFKLFTIMDNRDSDYFPV